MSKRIRVLIVDDSALIREILREGLSKDPGLEVVGTANDPYMARDRIVELNPEVLTLDIEMPRMDGVEFLRKLMPQYPLPVVVVSALTERGKKVTLDALEAGAVDFVTKPGKDLARGLESVMIELRTKIKLAAGANVSHWKTRREHPSRPIAAKAGNLSDSTERIIVIGASTGGTEAIREILVQFPASTPGIVIVQHMPPGFTKLFSERLNNLCQLEVREAETGDRVIPGRVLIAPGGNHMTVLRSGGRFEVSCQPGALVNGHCPSVDVLMHSAAKAIGKNAVGVILTGMGNDGAAGLKAMRNAGAVTIGQDEASCVVFGMPKAASEAGAVSRLLPLSHIPQAVYQAIDTEIK